MTDQERRQEYTAAVLEGRYASAEFIAQGLEPIAPESIIRPPAKRQSWGCSGSIGMLRD